MQAKKAGMTFENQGVSSSVKNAVFTGSPIEQARQAAKQVGAELIIDDEKMLLIPNGGKVKCGHQQRHPNWKKSIREHYLR